jgi:hypothetical protein
MGWVAGIEEEVKEVNTEVVFIFLDYSETRMQAFTPLPVAEYLVICVRVFTLR